MKLKHCLFPLLLALLVLGFDQATKIWALGATEDGFIRITSFFNLVLVWNRGVSFGMGGAGAISPYVLAAFSALIAAGFTFWIFKSPRKLVSLACGLVVGGAIGNIIDRFRFGAVVDFLDFHIAGKHWPAFNIADAAIVIGIGLILLDGLWLEPREKAKSDRNLTDLSDDKSI